MKIFNNFCGDFCSWYSHCVSFSNRCSEVRGCRWVAWYVVPSLSYLWSLCELFVHS